MQKFIILALVFFLLIPGSAQGTGSKPLRVVTSFSIIDDLTRIISGGDGVIITPLVRPESDPHVFQPTPETLITVKQADVVIQNGLSFEPWLDKILDTAPSPIKRCIATTGVPLRFVHLPDHGEPVPDPHAWHHFGNITHYINNIKNCLSDARPKDRDLYEKRARALLKRIKKLKDTLHKSITAIPQTQRVVITGHDAFGYLGAEFKITFKAPLGISTDAKASAKTVATLIEDAKTHGIKALFLENLASQDLIKQIAQEVGIDIGANVLYADALSNETGPASTYLDMMRFNIESLIREMRKNTPTLLPTDDLLKEPS
ncbi:MAG: zinc ABC transporter substrate-binding protein [Alphaproteobacteria bacterium]|nr:zinc ABC transporter substrate-binding protein [Alphaproteobacteria bacterium]